VSSYADTSFVISWFVPDANHAAAVAHMQSSTLPLRLPWTPWSAVEFNNSARALCARSYLTVASLLALSGQLRGALAAGDLSPKPLPAYTWWLESESISKAHTIKLGVRTLDVLHVAAARVLGAERFLTFDLRQRALAKAVGLTVEP